MNKQEAGNWEVMPATSSEIARVRERCRKLVRTRAAVSAGVAAVPVPGVDLVSDLATFALLVEEVNRAFGLTAEQIEQLHPRVRIVAYEAAAAIGGMLVGKIITKELVLRLFKKSGVKLAAKSVAKFVPLAGQLASAAIGYALFRRMGYEHVEACARVAREVVAAAKPV
ncbi:hypothetical protein GCM10027321_37710 [Massilia terrae]|uniref:DUF697 domain-containing protein n=1 Tax=Massilia terrae TaxID=1811224 RepID=A0ABT2D4P6_9BURK|nr:hypothetical protein [Massilia terrae]MCS0661099.1 hypothetical protein [Massilia terrae]